MFWFIHLNTADTSSLGRANCHETTPIQKKKITKNASTENAQDVSMNSKHEELEFL